MDPQPSFDMIQDGFHRQVRQYGDELISFVSAELRGPTSGLSITLEGFKNPESQATWLWFVGSADPAIEQAVLRFFQTDAGKNALKSDVVEFKLASTLLRLPGSKAEYPICHHPAGLTTATTATLQDGQEFMIVSEGESPPHAPARCVAVATGGWLQVSPRMHFSHVLLVKPLDQQARKSRQCSLGLKVWHVH
jgi:hypothetical protein